MQFFLLSSYFEITFSKYWYDIKIVCWCNVITSTMSHLAVLLNENSVTLISIDLHR